jgi:DNA repair protein RadC
MQTQRIKTIKAVYETAPEYMTCKPRARFTSSREIFSWFQTMKDETKESFICLHLDSKNTLVCAEVVSVGSLNASIVHPREVFKTALLSNAAALVFIHNHPSGDPTPSSEDMELTTRLCDAGKLLGIRILDHIIIGEDRYKSFADAGLIGD